MIVEHTRNDRWLSNTWLVGDETGGHAVVIDTGGPLEPIVQKVEELRLTVTHVLCTHHHVDHVLHNGKYRQRYGCPVCGHPAERELFDGLDREIGDGDEIRSGDLRIRALHIPGHTVGQLAFLVDEERVFTGDTLFRGSVGGTRGPGHGTYDQLVHSIQEVLMRLPPETVVHPGHMDETTVGLEWEQNPFIRLWRGLDEAKPRPCTALGEQAELLLLATDYDGGGKCVVRFEDGRMDVVPGSRVRVG